MKKTLTKWKSVRKEIGKRPQGRVSYVRSEVIGQIILTVNIHAPKNHKIDRENTSVEFDLTGHQLHKTLPLQSRTNWTYSTLYILLVHSTILRISSSLRFLFQPVIRFLQRWIGNSPFIRNWKLMFLQFP